MVVARICIRDFLYFTSPHRDVLLLLLLLLLHVLHVLHKQGFRLIFLILVVCAGALAC